MLRVAMLSRWHVHANEYANTIQRNDAACVTAVWDEDPSRGQGWADELGVPFVGDYGSVLAREDVDAVCVVTPTNIHRDIMIQAAQAKKHIFTEKVLTPTVAEAIEVADAVRQSGIQFCISFPRRTIPEIRYAKQAIDDGMLGQVTAIRIRIAHAGSSRDWLPPHFYDPVACGGGAMMDLGAHGMYLSRWLGGSPRRVVSIFSNMTDREVEDNAISVIEFDSGAIAVNETSFVAYPDSYSIEIDGMDGGYRMLSPREGAQIRSDKLESKGWQTPDSLPPRSQSPIDQWVAACHGGEPAEYGIDDAVHLTELMEAAYVSYRDRVAVEIGTAT